ICTGVTIADRAMISAGVIFTNDRYPRACEGDGLAPSGPTEETLATKVGAGVTIGARAVIGPGIEIGDYAMIGMGAVVVHNVPPHALVYGSPARIHGWVCACGYPVLEEPWIGNEIEGVCGKCGRELRARRREVETEILQERKF
ncbi:MAG TPA: DapH/DapD/GlmU-related protein, partial [Terriglobales bacterium]|nr:DapH/DapD/GlmU-related protein [Terriglobales bacterium]